VYNKHYCRFGMNVNKSNYGYTMLAKRSELYALTVAIVVGYTAMMEQAEKLALVTIRVYCG